jgi:hypothetical protein
MFFSEKYTITFINSKWEIVKSDIKMKIVPQRDEYIYMDDKYYDVLNVVHSLGKKHNILVIIDETKLKLNVNLNLNEEILDMNKKS